MYKRALLGLAVCCFALAGFLVAPASGFGPPGSTTTTTTTTTPGPQSCVDVAPTSTLASIVSSYGANTTFCLEPGTYSLTSHVQFKDGDVFEATDSSNRPVLDAGAHSLSQVFYVTPSSMNTASFYDLVIENAVSDGGNDLTGRGISGGQNLYVYDVDFIGNQQVGMGGQNGAQIVSSQFSDNGGFAPQGCCNGGVKEAHAYGVSGSTFTDNNGPAIWCDVGCDGGTFDIEGNTITGDTQGIRYEISGTDTGAYIYDNDITDTASGSGTWAIVVNSSENATVDANTVSGTEAWSISAQGNRSPGIANDLFEYNMTNGAPIQGCSLSGVTCTGNT